MTTSHDALMGDPIVALAHDMPKLLEKLHAFETKEKAHGSALPNGLALCSLWSALRLEFPEPVKEWLRFTCCHTRGTTKSGAASKFADLFVIALDGRVWLEDGTGPLSSPQTEAIAQRKFAEKCAHPGKMLSHWMSQQDAVMLALRDIANLGPGLRERVDIFSQGATADWVADQLARATFPGNAVGRQHRL